MDPQDDIRRSLMAMYGSDPHGPGPGNEREEAPMYDDAYDPDWSAAEGDPGLYEMLVRRRQAMGAGQYEDVPEGPLRK